MPALVPQVGGFLETSSFVRLLAHALDCAFTGTLVVEESGGFRHGVYFERGIARKAKTACPVTRLGDVLLEQGALPPAIHQRTLERALSERRLHGEVLMSEGALDEQALSLALKEQLSRQVLWLFGRPPESRFGFFSDANLLASWGADSSPRVSPLELIWRALRDLATPSEIDAALEEWSDRPLRLRDDLPLDYLFFLGSDHGVVERLRARPHRLAELVSGARASEDRVRRVVCLLVFARVLDLGVRSAPPLGLDPEALPLVALPQAPRIPNLSVSQPPPSRPAGEPAGESGVAAVDHAHSELTAMPPSNDTSAGAPRRSRAAAEERAQRSANAFQRAEVLASQGSLEAARRELATALEHEPEPHYLALSAWLEAQTPEPDLRRVARDLERAYRLAENQPTVRWYRGLVFQRLGKHAAALAEFRFVMEKQPRHIDAARQVRIYEMRLRNSPRDRPSLSPEQPAPRPRSGLFSWFRKAKP